MNDQSITNAHPHVISKLVNWDEEKQLENLIHLDHNWSKWNGSLFLSLFSIRGTCGTQNPLNPPMGFMRVRVDRPIHLGTPNSTAPTMRALFSIWSFRFCTFIYLFIYLFSFLPQSSSMRKGGSHYGARQSSLSSLFC